MRLVGADELLGEIGLVDLVSREGGLRSYGFERGRFVDNVVHSRLPE